MNEHTEALAARLTQLLNDPETCADAVIRLISAKAVFGYLDDALRSGDALPNRWTARNGHLCEFHAITDHYDRPLRGPPGDRRTLHLLARDRQGPGPMGAAEGRHDLRFSTP